MAWLQGERAKQGNGGAVISKYIGNTLIEGTEPKIKWLLPVASVNNHRGNVDCLIARWNVNRETEETTGLESGKLRAVGSHAIVLGICFRAPSCHTLNTRLTSPPLPFLYQMGALTFVS